ncbi:MAG: 50S ribosomal protein L32e [Candidatus Aenigmarchaeota archaeon]|nr:50S ribosomal protein L32e [Candidatus Aenigmarchaeota archaeon]
MKEKEELLEVRKKIKKKKPEFKRQEWFRKKSLGKKWRKPRGIHSKLRRQEKAKGALPRPGYGSPSGVRGLNREGYREVIVRNAKDLENVNPKEDVAVISKTVGRKKKLEILEMAKKRNIKVGNYKLI